ncbi:hypothetical protein SO802_033713 [Lithocarpus litseifolius]|uniref:Uncharacterized protein n=1 Tax=Lithocarpus litseifolius TaxID=425828 RepID=A0AAW2BF52_9ROSI
MKTIINEGNVVNQVETSILEEICEKDFAKVENVHSTNSTMGFGMLEMHESFNFNELGKLDQRGPLFLLKLQICKEGSCSQVVPAVELLQLLQQRRKL